MKESNVANLLGVVIIFFVNFQINVFETITFNMGVIEL